jgi:hypothetical protein
MRKKHHLMTGEAPLVVLSSLVDEVKERGPVDFDQPEDQPQQPREAPAEAMLGAQTALGVFGLK